MEPEAIVVGASWAGIWTLHLLKQRGVKVLLVDANEDVGGTWCYTRYPGCHVDTEIPLYEFSHPDLWRNWTWSKRFPDRKQIQAYLSWVTDRLGLRKSLVLQTRVQRAEWNEKFATWTVSLSSGASYRTRYLILCTGYSTVPFIPNFTGAETFKDSFHTSSWPEELVWNNKRVGVIGTAASGLQIIETLGPQVAQLSVFQRTPNFATPKRQKHYAPGKMDYIKQNFYPDMLKQRNSKTGFFTVQHRRTFDDPADARQRFFQSLWEEGGLSFWFGNYADLLTSREANMEAYRFWRGSVHARVHDKNTAEKLAPANPPHAFGAKRPSLETSYFETFNLPNVELVDVNEDLIQEITATGIQTRTKFHALDIIVYATGFDALTGSGLAIDIRGAGGVKLETKWDTRAEGNGVSTALGMMSAGFPNLFFPMGPQAPSALGLTPQMAEIQGKWVTDCIEYMKARGLGRVEPTVGSEEKWAKEVNAAAESTLFGEADSWYMGVNIPGRKKQPLCYFGGVGTYAEHLQQAVDTGYEGFTMAYAGGRSSL
ncbi:flavin-containing monooxygenase [Aspergillus lucknowensis]|uniref:L-ornithine N(5)-monooxygenase n=1 Tax=Aspergillus lucknowensis TaxID=176173 RepID=A0ABR4LL63_9EURO